MDKEVILLNRRSVPDDLPVKDWPEIVRLKEGFCQMQICTTIPPERKHEINDKLVIYGLSESGTEHGWKLDEECKPVECAEARGIRWHYICVC